MINYLNTGIRKHDINNHMNPLISYSNKQFRRIYRFTKAPTKVLLRIEGHKFNTNRPTLTGFNALF